MISAALMRRKLFALAYLGEAKGNVTEAAKIAGFSHKTAYSLGSRLLKEPAVLELIERTRAEILARAAATAVVDKARVLKELERIAFSDPADWFDETNAVKHVREMSEDARRALKSVKVKRMGGGRTALTETVELAFWSKPDTLVNLGRELGLVFPTRLEHTGAGGAPIITAAIELTPDERRARLAGVLQQLLATQREGAPL